MTRWHRRLTGGCVALALLLSGACSGAPEQDASGEPSPSPAVPPASLSTSPLPDRDTAPDPPAPHPISTLALAEARLSGSDLRIGAVREQTASFTSYDVTFRSRTSTGTDTRTLRISGVLNVPAGEGPFPAVVLAHGYVDPAIYVRGQGMTRERGRLADRGFVALHVDYRNHAESDDDPRVATAVELGYAADVLNAAQALRRSPDVAVDPERVSLFGRSMGGGVVMQAMVAKPDAVHAGVAWASVSSLEAENFRHFDASDPPDSSETRRIARRHGLPDANPGFWRRLSPRPYFDRLTAPLLLVHGRHDDTCPPVWARETQRALAGAGAESELAWFEDGHAFGPAFDAAMDRVIAFLRRA